MNDLRQIVADRLEQLRQDIVANIEQKSITASGRTQRSLQVQVYSDGVRLIAQAGERAPIPTLEVGRPGGRVPRNFTDIIVEWSKDKGLAWGDDKRRRKIAGAVAWGKIRREGTRRHKQHEDVYSTLVTKAAEDIRGIVTAKIREMIKTKH